MSSHSPPLHNMNSLNLSHQNHNGFSSRDNLVHNNSLVSETIQSYPRKRHNPLYDSSDLQKDTTVKSTSSNKDNCCVYFLLFIVFLLSMLSVCLSVYAIIKADEDDSGESPSVPARVISGDDDKVEYNASALDHVVSRLDGIERQLQTLNATLSQYQQSSTQNASRQNELISQLSDSVIELGGDVQRLQRNVSEFSRQQGPVGPAGEPGESGAGNLTQCGHLSLVDTFGGTTMPNDTPVYPRSPDDHENWVIVGTECATTGGTLATLNVENTQGYKTFHCVCSGKADAGTTSRRCTLHIWRCPKIS